MFLRTERSLKEFYHLYPVVSILTIINFSIWLLINLPLGNISNIIVNVGIGHNLLVSQGEIWRLFTPIFLHLTLTHVLFNSFSLVIFGPALERMLGKSKFLAIYLITGIVGNIGTYVINPLSLTPHLGASGAIYGLLGLYLYMVVFRKDLMRPTDAQIVIIILVIGLIMTFIGAGINRAAHVFGGIGGFALGPLLFGRSNSSNTVHFGTARRRRSFRLPRFQKEHIIWIVIGILVIAGIIGRFM